MDHYNEIFKELESYLDSYLKQEKDELLKFLKKDKITIIKDLFKRGLERLSGILKIDFYKIPEEQRKEYEDKLIHIMQTIMLRNIDIKIDISKTVKFVTTFEIYSEHIGDFDKWLSFIPKPMWKNIDGVAYAFSKRFVETHSLVNYEKLPHFPSKIKRHQLLEALAFLLKIAWERGYLMYKFKEFDCFPPPNDEVDVDLIMNTIETELSGNLDTYIDVFFQRLISECTEEAPIRATFDIFEHEDYGNDVLNIVEPLLHNWAKEVRKAYGFGVLVSKLEEHLFERDF